MFSRLLSKGLKRISINSKKSHIFLKNTDFSLVIVRPYDLVQLGDFVGSGSEDILIWTGKTIGRTLCNNIRQNKRIKNRKKLFDALMDNLENLGYGNCDIDYKKGKSAKLEISNSLIEEIDDLTDAELIKNLYNGIIIGAFNSAGLEVDQIGEVKLEKNKPIVFEYNIEEVEEF